MKRVKHTPGPWYVKYYDDALHMCMTVIGTKDYGDGNLGLFDNEEDTVAIVYHQCSPAVDPDPDTANANARLIAAAPEMFEFIKKLNTFNSNIAKGPILNGEIERLLNKVEG